MPEAETNPAVLPFTEPRKVYLLDVHGDAVDEPLLKPENLWSGAGIAIQSPWDEGRFLPGIARGKDGQFVMELGDSIGKLVFHPELGWHCMGLVRREAVMGAVEQQLIDEEIEKAKEASRSFTEKLVKKAAKKT